MRFWMNIPAFTTHPTTIMTTSDDEFNPSELASQPPLPQDHPSPLPEKATRHYHLMLEHLLLRVDKALQKPESALHRMSLTAVQRLIFILSDILESNTVEGKPYFILDLSETLNLHLFEQIFHLESQDRLEEFVLRQMFCLLPENLSLLPNSNREELIENWFDRFTSASQAIQVEVFGEGILRGFTTEEQQLLFESLEDGSIQMRAFPKEEVAWLKPELDHDLRYFGELIQEYLGHTQSLEAATIPMIIREQQRFNRLIEIYSFPCFLAYQYYRCLLDYLVAEQRDQIDLVEQAKQSDQNKTPQTGDKDLDKLFDESSGVEFISWPTGKDQIYGQEQYLKHFITRASLDSVAQVAHITPDTKLTVFVFDVSGSMLAHDVEPSRFEYAVDLQEELAGRLPENVALAQISFSTVGVISHIFGQSRDEFLDLLISSRKWFHRARHTVDMFGSTSLGAGLLSAVSLIDQTRKALGAWGRMQPAEILLFSDGDHNCPPNYYQAARFCQQRRIEVHSICCAREVCVEVEVEGKWKVKTLRELVEQEALDRAKKWRFWYPETSFQSLLEEQRKLVLNHYRHRLQQNLQRSTGANTEAFTNIEQLTGGHFFHGPLGEEGPTTADDILEHLTLRDQLREKARQMIKAEGRVRKRKPPKRVSV